MAATPPNTPNTTEADKVSNMLVVKMAEHRLPSTVEAKGKEWCTYGENDDYMYMLLELYQKSAYHQGLIEGKVDYICGGGWSVVHTGLTVTAQAEANRFLSQKWGSDTLDELTRKACYDGEIIGGFALIIKAAKGSGMPTIEQYPICDVRPNKDRTKFFTTSFWYTVNKNGTLKKNTNPEKEADFKVYPAYDPKKLKADKEQMLYHVFYRPKVTGLNIFPAPSYLAGIQAIQSDVLLSAFHHTNIDEGFVGTKYIQFFNGKPTQEIKDDIEENFKSKHAGVTGNRIIFGFFDSPERAVKIEDLSPNEIEKQFEHAEKRIEQQIFVAHQVPSKTLFGIEQTGVVFSRNDIEIQNELFQSRYVNARQREYEKVFNQIAHDFGINVTLKLKRHDPIGLDWFGNNNLWGLLSDDQKMEKAGLSTQKLAQPSQTQQFSDTKTLEDVALELFAESGNPCSDYEELHSVELCSTDIMDVRAAESILLKMDFATLEGNVSSLARSVLDLLNKDALMPREEIAKVLKVSTGDISKAIEQLIRREYLEPGKAVSGGDKIPEYSVTKSGSNVLEQQGAKTEKIEVRYRYEVKSGMGKPVIETTRDFCRKLIDLDKLYTREEIEIITNRVGYNVWEMRGGWYTKPGTTIHVPSCRHIWKQKVVRVK